MKTLVCDRCLVKKYQPLQANLIQALGKCSCCQAIVECSNFDTKRLRLKIAPSQIKTTAIRLNVQHISVRRAWKRVSWQEYNV